MQLKYLEDMAFVHPSRIVDMDGIHYNPKDYLERCGWTSMGQEAYALQLIIRGNVPPGNINQIYTKYSLNNSPTNTAMEEEVIPGVSFVGETSCPIVNARGQVIRQGKLEMEMKWRE
jgi:hypothetical protein